MRPSACLRVCAQAGTVLTLKPRELAFSFRDDEVGCVWAADWAGGWPIDGKLLLHPEFTPNGEGTETLFIQRRA